MPACSDSGIRRKSRLVRDGISNRGKREIESRTFAWRGFNPYPATVPFDNPFASGQSDPHAGILAARVQPLKDDKNALEIDFADADAIVAN